MENNIEDINKIKRSNLENVFIYFKVWLFLRMHLKKEGKPYSEIVNIAKDYIKARGGFEKFAKWGLI